jgi:NAD(P)-dependent dehydrogenase (short-subunit alcohol dehydrogenase family)
MKLVLADINLDHAQQEADKYGDSAIGLHLDVTSLDNWATAKSAAYAHFGQVDVLCNNAGISQPRQPLDQIPPQTFERVMAINTTGIYNGVVTFAQDMRQRGTGHIVNTSSMNGLLPFATFGAYSASKFAVTGMSEALRDELAPSNIGVSILFPGLTRSRMSQSDIESGDIPPEVAAKGLTDPLYLGRAVVKAIEENQLYIISHPEYRSIVELRCQRILEAHGVSAEQAFSQ